MINNTNQNQFIQFILMYIENLVSKILHNVSVKIIKILNTMSNMQKYFVLFLNKVVKEK